MKLLVDTNKVPFQQVSRKKEYPGVGKIPDQFKDVEQIYYKFLGRDPKTGPFMYIVKFPAGHHIQKHSHAADRVEYLLEGEITFDGEAFRAGSFSFVSAHTEYEYDIVKDTTILLIFHGPPGVIM
jgi:quercetin dioxygenase-like cupin family protein